MSSEVKAMDPAYEMELLPIKEQLNENQEFLDHPDCQESIHLSLEFYKKVGYQVPWNGYYARIDGQLVGSAGFKGKPINGMVEIAYGTFPAFRIKGIGTEICRQLVRLSLKTDSSVRIFARTFDYENYSTRILQENGFECKGPVLDDEDGEVWEWEFKNNLPAR